MIRNVGPSSNQPTPQREETQLGSKKDSEGVEAKASVDIGDMHASAQFGTNDLNNAWNSTVDAIEHPGDVIDHAEEDISNAAEVEGNEILYGKVPQNPLPPNPITDAIQAASDNPSLVHATLQGGDFLFNIFNEQGTTSEELSHIGGQLTNAERGVADAAGKAVAGAENAASGAWNQASDAASNAADAASDAASDAGDAASNAADAAGDAVDDLF